VTEGRVTEGRVTEGRVTEERASYQVASTNRDLKNVDALAVSQGVHGSCWPVWAWRVVLGGELVQAKHELRLAVCCLVLVDDAFGCCLVEALHSHLEGFSAYF
jgi:hypothetical protein